MQFTRREFVYLLTLLLFVYSSESISYEPLYQPEVPDTFYVQIDKGKVEKHISRIYGGAMSAPIIKDKYKKWTKASISTDAFLTDNFIRSKVRITGDDPKHINASEFKSSLKIKLTKGNIANITKFRLLLSETQGGTDEIFWSLLMETLGFPTPYKKIVTVNLLGTEYSAIFEESIEKEFIERWGFRESPIISIDERQLMENIQFSQIERPEYYGPSILNKAFLKNSTALKIAYEAMFADNYYRLKEFYKINGQYAKHGLAINNRRFLYDPIFGYKVPLYFDGNPTIDIQESDYAEKRNIDCNKVSKEWVYSDQETRKIFNKFTNNFIERAKGKVNYIQSCIAKKIITDSTNLKEYEVKTFLPRKSKPKDTFDFTREFIGTGSQIDLSNLENYIGSSPELFRYNYNDERFELCSMQDYSNKIISCEFKNFEDSVNYLSGNSKHYNFNNVKVYPLVIEQDDKSKSKIFRKSILLNSSQPQKIFIDSNETLLIETTEKVQKVNIVLNDPFNSRVIFKGFIGDKFNLDVKAPRKNTSNSDIRYDQRLLTACITFIDTIFNGGSMSMTGGACEDSINLIRSSGNIDSINIRESEFDGLDIDFSKLNIKNLEILNAKNDCIDLSSGNYNLYVVNAVNCGDKGISIGEKSRVTVNQGYLDNGSIGIAVKDSSIAYIHNLNINNMKDVCLTAYRKKQEFDGGNIYGSKIRCDNLEKGGGIFSDQESKIFLDQKDICLYLGSINQLDFCIFKNHILFQARNCFVLDQSVISVALVLKNNEQENDLTSNGINILDQSSNCHSDVQLPIIQEKIQTIQIYERDKVKVDLYDQISIQPDFYLQDI